MSVKVQSPKVIGEKQLRLAGFCEENILPEDELEVRKRLGVKTSRYVAVEVVNSTYHDIFFKFKPFPN
jgi:hypothetical protein